MSIGDKTQENVKNFSEIRPYVNHS